MISLSSCNDFKQWLRVPKLSVVMLISQNMWLFVQEMINADSFLSFSRTLLKLYPLIFVWFIQICWSKFKECEKLKTVYENHLSCTKWLLPWFNVTTSFQFTRLLASWYAFMLMTSFFKSHIAFMGNCSKLDHEKILSKKKKLNDNENLRFYLT